MWPLLTLSLPSCLGKESCVRKQSVHLPTNCLHVSTHRCDWQCCAGGCCRNGACPPALPLWGFLLRTAVTVPLLALLPPATPRVTGLYRWPSAAHLALTLSLHFPSPPAQGHLTPLCEQKTTPSHWMVAKQWPLPGPLGPVHGADRPLPGFCGVPQLMYPHLCLLSHLPQLKKNPFYQLLLS